MLVFPIVAVGAGLVVTRSQLSYEIGATAIGATAIGATAISAGPPVLFAGRGSSLQRIVNPMW